MKIILKFESGSLKGVSKEFEGKDVIVIGRESGPGVEAFDVNLPHAADTSVSRPHCEIRLTDGACYIKNLNVKNVTFVNGVGVSSSPLSDGDVIRLGKNGPVMKVEISGLASPALSNGVRAKTPEPLPGERVVIDTEKDEPVKPPAEGAGKAPGASKKIGRATILRLLSLVRREGEETRKSSEKRLKGRIAMVAAVVVLLAAAVSTLGVIQRRDSTEARESREMIGVSLAAIDEKIRALEESSDRNSDDIKKLNSRMRSLRRALSSMGAEVSAVRKAVVRINTTYDVVQSGTGRVAVQGGSPLRMKIQGSGFSIRADGYILTNAHVVVPWEYQKGLVENGFTGRVRSFSATFDGTSEPLTPSVVAMNREADIAILKVNRSPCPFIPFEETAPTAGQRVFVLGYPSAVEDSEAGASCMVLGGIIGKVGGDGRVLYDVMTHAGNSGGPVINEKGRLVAMHRAGIVYDGAKRYLHQSGEELLVLSGPASSGGFPEGTVDVTGRNLLHSADEGASLKNINTGVSLNRIRDYIGAYIN